MNDSLQTLSGSQRNIVEKISARFEMAWQQGAEPEIEEFLLSDESLRQAVLIELVHAELEFRVKAGQAARVEEYLQRYPQLAEKSETIVELVVAEYEQRLRREGYVSTEAYRERFPEYVEQLSGRLREPATEMVASNVTQTTAVTIVQTSEGAQRDVPKLVAAKKFGNYVLLEEIARGGMGVVYRARDEKLQRIVALKMIISGHLAGAEELQRFETEARAAAKLKHPHIVTIYEVGEVDGQRFFSMDYIEGESLAQRLNKTVPSARQAAKYVRQMAEAIAYAHQEGVLHRDLKPQNILIDQKGQLRITDFGLAKQLEDDSGVTGTGQALGTPSYMPPEQAGSNPSEVGPASDVYSLGAVLYELLTGRPPFKSHTPLDTLLQVLEQDPVPPRKLDHTIARDLETITLKCLEKQPSKRYASADELSAELDRFLEGKPIQARPVGPGERAWRFCKRKPALAGMWALACTLLLTLVIGGLMWALQQGKLRTRAEIASKDEAKKRRDAVRRSYNSDMLAAQIDWEGNNLGRLREFLERYDDNAGLKGFEWYYWKRLVATDEHTLQGGHGPVLSVAFSPDGQLVASGHFDGTVMVWDTADGDLVQTLIGHGGAVVSVAFGPSGRRIVSGSGEYEKSGRAEAWTKIEKGSHFVFDFLLPFLNKINRGEIKVWDVKTGEQILVLDGHRPAVRCVDFSPDGKWIVSAAGSDIEGKTTSEIKRWDAANGEELKPAKEVEYVVTSVAVGPDGQNLATVHGETLVGQTLTLRNSKNLEELSRPAVNGQRIMDAVFSSDGSRLATTSDDGTVTLWDAKTLEKMKGPNGQNVLIQDSISYPGGYRLALASWDDGYRLAVASADNTVNVWEGADDGAWVTLKGHSDVVTSVAFSVDGKQLASASRDGTVKLWNASPFRRQGPITLDGHTEKVFSVAFSPDGKQIASASGDKTVKLWDAATGAEMRSLEGHSNMVRSVVFSPDGKQIASASEDKTVKVWDTTTGDQVVDKGENSYAVWSVAFSADGKRLAWATSHSDDSNQPGVVKVWDFKARDPSVIRHNSQVYQVMFSPDGNSVAAAGFDGTVKVWDVDPLLRPERVTLTGHDDPVRSVAFDRDGIRIASGSLDKTVRVWNAETGREMLRLKGHTGEVYSVNFSPDGNRIVSGSADKTVKVWDAKTGQELLTLRGHSGAVVCVVFSHDGQRLASASEDKTVRIWDGPRTGE